MDLSFQQDSGGLILVHVRGKVTQDKVSSFTEPLSQKLGASCYSQKVLLDLAQAEYIDSSGVSWLLVCHKRFRENGGKLILFGIPPMVANVFKVLRMDAVFEIAPDKTGALKLALG